MFLLRTMQKAKYSSDNIGHFGLASKYYSHRRYSDLLLHRIIREVIIKNKDKIQMIAKQSFDSEVKAVELERRVNDVKKAEFYENKINNVEEATIVSIHKFGMFVEFADTTNSLVHISKISPFNEYEISPDFCQLILKDKTYKIGQVVKVKIISINKLEGKIDSIIV